MEFLQVFRDFLVSNQAESMLFLLSFIVAIQRIWLGFRYQYTIRSKYENLITAVVMVLVCFFYGLVMVMDNTAHSGNNLIGFIALSRLIWAWFILGEFWIGLSEAKRRNRGKALIRIARELENVVVVVEPPPDCPEPIQTLEILKELEEENNGNNTIG